MFHRDASFEVKTNRRGVVLLWNRVVLTASAAISSQESEKVAGFVVTKVGSESGRYLITLSGGAVARILDVGVKIIGVDDTAYTSGKGVNVGLLRLNADSTAGTIAVQLVEPEVATADTDPEDSTTLLFSVAVQTTL